MNLFKRLLKPSGTFHQNYFSYIGWSFVTNVITSTECALSMHSMLSVVSKETTDAVISTNYIGKDIIGQVGSLLYMSRFSKKIDLYPKKYINYSLALQQSSFFIECCTPILPFNNFLIIAGLSNIGTNVSYMGIGAINAKVIQKISMDNNVGEIYSKLTIINTIASSLGMMIGIAISSKLPDHEMRLGLLPILAVGRVYTFNKSIKGLIN